MILNTLNLFEKHFPTENSCLEYLEAVRWNGIVVSPFSITGKVYKCSNGQFRCRDTSRYFSAKTGTIFHNSRIPLKTWFKGIWIMHENPTVTSVQLSKDLGLTQKSAWLMQQRIRKQLGLKKRFVKVKSDESELADDKLNLLDWLSALKK